MNHKALPSPYREYCRPKLADLLKALRLDREYVRAQGAYLTDAEGNAVLDLIGGFGAAVLGHNPPELVEGLIDDIRAGVPFNAQCSRREAAGRLAERLSALTGVEIGYVTNFSNSGTEANEAAIKHAYKVHFDAVRREYERVTRSLHDFYKQADRLGSRLVLPGKQKNLIDFRDDVEEFNLGQFELYQNQPIVVALKGSYHGKTMSSLKVTFNKSYREGFEGLSGIQTVFVDPNTPVRFEDAVAEQQLRFLVPTLVGQKVELSEVRVNRVFALILEVVLGEGGIRPVPDASLTALAQIARRRNVAVILDEVQTGCGRTGSVFGYHGTSLANFDPEYISLSKALGGGVVKIGATLIRKDIYDPDFGILHTSTFGEDEVSSRTALRFLDELVARDGATLKEIERKGAVIVERLRALQTAFPDVIKDVRGRGLMIGVELKPLADKSPFFRATGKQGILSLLIASYLLHYHGIRLLAPLSTILKGNPGKERLSVLRIQPPSVVTEAEIERLASALAEVCAIVRANNEYCLVAHLIGVDVPDLLRRNPLRFEARYPLQPATQHIDARTGFVVHPTKLDYLVDYYFPSSRGQPFPRAALHRWWMSIARFLEPVHVHSSTIASHGFVVENSLVFVPYLPEYLAETTDRKLVQEIQDKVQDAVTIARELGDENIPVCMVGLGAYTSIVTQNGTTLNDYEVSVTSGNAYTVALTLLGLAHGAAARGLDVRKTTAAVVGATGNIGMVISQFLARQVDRLILVGRAREASERKLRVVKTACLEAALRLVRDAFDGEVDSLGGLALRMYEQLRPAWNDLRGDTGALGNFVRDSAWSLETANAFTRLLEQLPGADRTLGAIEVAVDLKELRRADLVAVATNSPQQDLIGPDAVKPGAIVCCTSVPTNLSQRFYEGETRGSLVFDGGLARLPAGNTLDFVGMPGGDLVYGCLAETLVLGFDGSDHSFCKGPVTMEQVEYILDAAQAHGFELGTLKLGDQLVEPQGALAAVD